jgi:predicted transcriptional regulator
MTDKNKSFTTSLKKDLAKELFISEEEFNADAFVKAHGLSRAAVEKFLKDPITLMATDEINRLKQEIQDLKAREMPETPSRRGKVKVSSRDISGYQCFQQSTTTEGKDLARISQQHSQMWNKMSEAQKEEYKRIADNINSGNVTNLPTDYADVLKSRLIKSIRQKVDQLIQLKVETVFMIYQRSKRGKNAKINRTASTNFEKFFSKIENITKANLANHMEVSQGEQRCKLDYSFIANIILMRVSITSLDQFFRER